ncbi:DNA-binding response regulator [Fulvitalea axinellae]|uniref:DNA-binding response regulator n=1 Tax=Fulvitalea axinellae TaxID=1182444 RepID=A0AAU9CPL1_9BACT|nr:DNA-binding response regulator [Fulvitalea axinellae]
MIEAVIIEDEDFAVERLRTLLEQTDVEVRVVAVLDSIKKSVQWLAENEVDLIFLDIHLADGSAFKIFEQIEVRSPIIFTTAYHEYALRAFEQMSVDYLLKPVNRQRLSQSLKKLEALSADKPATGLPADLERLADMLNGQRKPKNFLVNAGNKVTVVSSDEVAYFFTDAKLTFLFTHDGKRHVLDMSLVQLENTLRPYDFFRINRQFLISRQAVLELRYSSATRLKVYLKKSGHGELLVAREKIGQFKRWLAE